MNSQIVDAERCIGVDGCRAGWYYVDASGPKITFGIVETLAQLEINRHDRIFVDIPIGLADDAIPRSCDMLARKLLKGPRASSVFPPPVRAVLFVSDYAAALKVSRQISGKGLSKQAFAITPKIAEVDRFLRKSSDARQAVREVHPELCFWAFSGGRAMRYRKKTSEGFKERMEILDAVLPGSKACAEAAMRNYRRNQVARDDIADALVAAATANNPAENFVSIPLNSERDSHDLPMEMVFSAACLEPDWEQFVKSSSR